jgi:histone acetyltransferase 1
MRPRISQVLVLPPFQNLGIGTKLIESIYQHFLRKQNIADITFEDQSEILQFVRLSVDAKLCKNLPEFSAENLKKGLTKEMLRAANENFKLNPKQVRVVCEVLRLAVTDRENKKEYQDYRIFVKKRLNLIFQKQKNDLFRAQKHGANVKTEIAALPSIEDRQQILQVDYEEAEVMYLRVLERVNKALSGGGAVAVE